MEIRISGRTDKGLFLTIDDLDADLIEGHSICASGKIGRQYAVFRHGGKIHYVHVLIARRMGITGRVDHKNRNRLDCTRRNLRAASHGLNMSNVGLKSNNTTGLKGVVFHKQSGKYVARVLREHLGLFVDKYDAARAYDKRALELRGEFALTNAMLGLYPDQKEGT
jgi:hypothetical protein